eukprot:COSAG03_NODE_25697_length_264_cov_0.624242_1_plen_73_part_10
MAKPLTRHSPPLDVYPIVPRCNKIADRHCIDVKVLVEAICSVLRFCESALRAPSAPLRVDDRPRATTCEAQQT